MSPEIYFSLTLVVKMAVTAAFVVTATIAAERAGPLVGGLVTTLPISAGPAYLFLALDHSARFIADGALMTLVFNAVNTLFAVVYVLLAQRHSLAISLGGAFMAWLLAAPILPRLPWTLASAIAVNAVIILLALRVTRELRHTRAPRVQAHWHELLIRAAGVALLVGTVITFSFRIGSAASGMLATLPVVFTSVIFIMHRRVGGPPAAAVLANAVLGMIGFALACVALHVATAPLGTAPALALSLATSFAWGGLVYALRKWSAI